MVRVMLLGALLLSVGCGGKTSGGETTDESATGPPRPARREVFDFEFIALAEPEVGEQVWLVASDEMGASRRVKLRSYPAQCTRGELGQSGSAIAGELLAAECRGIEGGIFDVRIVHRRGELVYLEARLHEEGAARRFEERGRFPVPAGAAVSAVPLD